MSASWWCTTSSPTNTSNTIANIPRARRINRVPPPDRSMSLAAPRSISQEVTDDPPLSPSGVTPFGSNYLGFFRLSLYALVTLVLTPVQILILLVARRYWWALPFAYHKLCCRIMGLQVRVIGNPAKARPVLFVSNHVSYLDIPVLGSITPVAFVEIGRAHV